MFKCKPTSTLVNLPACIVVLATALKTNVQYSDGTIVLEVKERVEPRYRPFADLYLPVGQPAHPEVTTVQTMEDVGGVYLLDYLTSNWHTTTNNTQLIYAVYYIRTYGIENNIESLLFASI